MEPIKVTVKTVLDVIEEVQRIKLIRSYDKPLVQRVKAYLYVDVLKQIARLSTDEYARDMAIEALNAEEDTYAS